MDMFEGLQLPIAPEVVSGTAVNELAMRKEENNNAPADCDSFISRYSEKNESYKKSWNDLLVVG